MEPIKHNSATLNGLDLLSAKNVLAELHPNAPVGFEALSLAGKIIRDAYLDNRLAAFDRKHWGDLVTETDKLAEAAALKVLQITTPEFAVVSEESCPGDVSLDKPTWVLDPLDGTAAFIFRTRPEHPAVLIALYQNGQYELAMVYRPIVDEWYVAVRGKGAYLLTAQQGLVKLGTLSREGRLASGWVALNWYGDSVQESEVLKGLTSRLRSESGAQLVTVEAPHSSIGCDVVRLASPIAVVHDNNSSRIKQAEWDIAPIRLIVEEAGGVFMDFAGRRYLGPKQGPIVVAANAAVASELMALEANEIMQPQFLEIVRPDVDTFYQFFMNHGVNEWNYLPSHELRAHLELTRLDTVRLVAAFQSGKLVGVATYEVGDFYPHLRVNSETAEPAGYVSEVTIHRDHQSRGLGAKFLLYIADILREEGVREVFAKRHEENLGSAGMMKKVGFKIRDVFEDPIRTSGSRRSIVEGLLLG